VVVVGGIARGMVRGLHLGSGSAMKLCSTPLDYLWLEAALSGPQQAKVEPPDKERVNSSGHDRFPKLESVPASVSIVPPRERTKGLTGRS
jgi:hypothetical protein